MQVLLVVTLWEVAREGGERSGHGAETGAVRRVRQPARIRQCRKTVPGKSCLYFAIVVTKGVIIKNIYCTLQLTMSL